MTRRASFLSIVIAALLVAGVAIATYVVRHPPLPAQGSTEYEQVSRAFYRGLAALEVGLLDNARQDFSRATQIVPEEPAAWANLGLTLIRLGELDAAAEPISRAVALAPRNADVALLAGRMEVGRGRLEPGLEQLKRAVSLDPRGLPARFAVAEEIERGELTPASRREAQALLDELLALAPKNLAILIERTRLAAADDRPLALEMIRRIAQLSSGWPAEARQQLEDVTRALDGSNSDEAVRALTRLRNVLARVPAYRQDLAAVRTPPELIAEPFTEFLALKNPSPAPDPPDMATTFTLEPAGDAPVTALTVLAFDATKPPVIVPRGVTPLDWNRDFRTDFVQADASGLRLFEQDATGQMLEATSRAAAGSPFSCGCFAAWAADIEMDGDLDIVVGLVNGPTAILRNNGDGTWLQRDAFATVTNARSFAWGDIDGDADPDAVFVDSAGVLRVLQNGQAGQFAELPRPNDAGNDLTATIADADADGTLDVVALASNGAVTAYTWTAGRWRSMQIAEWSDVPRGSSPGTYRLFMADLDNNGALDLIASGPQSSRVWLADAHLKLAPLGAPVQAAVFGVADMNGDGRVDLAAVAGGRAVRMRSSGQKPYHWKSIRARAQETAGDQRINSFGVGGDIQVRSGLLVQKQVLTGLPAHFGLGSRTAIDVARIVWPNGVPQAEFDGRVDDVIVAEQRLKGSCPWLFAWDGTKFVFVTDFLWRSPLGLRINAQDTAGTTQTEDRVRIRQDQLVPRRGAYELRITAELWETHFFDHVSLVALDHPAGVDVFVDERFSPVRQQDRTLHAVQELHSVANARDDQGRDVQEEVAALDGRYLATFARGEYQGIARDHFVEFDVRPGAAPHDRRVLVAQGWVYPTDSSINVAIGQRRTQQPTALSLEAQDASGTWRTVEPDLGFPAGKNKTMVIALDRIGDARRLRLRSNLEIYWDALRVGTVVDAPIQSRRLPLAAAALQYRGFSVTTSTRGDAPETPEYTRLANTTARWRDLEGYYTRFGDVKELLVDVDDRYVIMNAGDEMRLRFPAGSPPAAGMTRDFVLVGDGWEKDGDYNTDYSATVTPLPSHADAAYRRASGSPDLEQDPVYRAHRGDWEHFHTRYVTPERFLKGLR